MKAKLLLFAAPLVLAGFTPAHATVVFGDQTINSGNVLENVLIGNNQSGSTVTGVTNQTNVVVDFTSATGQTLNTSASGQAVITAANALLNSITFSLAGGIGFTNFEFDLQGSGSSPQSVNLTTNLGNHVYANMDGNGANWAGAASSGEYFTSVTWIASAAGYDNMKQLRLGGVAAVPEASTWAMMLLGLGGIGWALRRKRHEVAKTTARISFA